MSVPKLRFPDFRDAGEWEEYALADIALEKLSNGVFNDPNKVGKGYKLVNVLDMYIESYIDETKLSLADISDTEFKKNKVENGDIFFTRSSLVKEGIAKSNIYLGNAHDITFDGHLIRLRPNKNITLPLFLHFGLRSEAVRSQLVAKGKTATMTTIGQSDIADTKILIAKKIEEQQKIADCLTSLDDRITLETHKLDTLKAHKKGLMQQLFPAEGETLPKLRFPEFQDLGEWEEKTIGNLLTIGNGKDYKHLSKGDIPVYGTGGYMLSVNDYLYDGESVCIGRKGTIDKPVLLSGKFWTVDTLFYTHSFKNCLPKFIYLCFQYINWLDYNAASGVPSLSKSTIENIALAIPSIPEQQKIADCLFSIDEAISLQSQAIDLLKLHKKGLMQQLFPSVEEVNR